MKTKIDKLDKNSTVKYAVAFIAAVLVIMCAIAFLKNSADISRLKAQAADYQTQYEQQINENEKIKAILDSDNKDEYIEQKAREKGYVKDGEIVFYDISSSK